MKWALVSIAILLMAVGAAGVCLAWFVSNAPVVDNQALIHRGHNAMRFAISAASLLLTGIAVLFIARRA